MSDLPNQFVERELTNVNFQRWLDLVKCINGQGLLYAEHVWDHISGADALVSGNLAFSAVKWHTIREAISLTIISRAQGSPSRHWLVMGEVRGFSNEGHSLDLDVG